MICTVAVPATLNPVASHGFDAGGRFRDPAWGGLAGLLLIAGTVCPDGSGHSDGRVPVAA